MSERRASVVLELVNRIGGPMRRIRKQVAAGTADLRRSFARVGRAGRNIFAGVSAAAVGIGAALGKATFDVASRGDEIAKFADQIGLSTDALQEYQYVAERQGVSQKLLNSSLVAFSKRLGEARAGSGALAAYLKKSNPELLKQLTATRDLEGAFDLYLQAIEATEDPTVRAAGAAAAFSRSGVGLVRITRDGSENIANLRKEAHRLGVVIDEDTARRAESFQDSFTNIKGSIRGVATILGSALMPAFQDAMDYITRLVVNNQDAIRQWSREFAANLPKPEQLRAFAGEMRDTARAIRNIVDMIGGWKVALAGVVGISLAPFILAVGSAVAATFRLTKTIATSTAARKVFGKAFAKNPLGTSLTAAKWMRWINIAGAVAAAGVAGWKIGSWINKKIEGTQIARTISNAVGRSVDQVMATFGSEAAQGRLERSPQAQRDRARSRAERASSALSKRQADELSKYRSGRPSAYDHIPLPDGEAPRAGDSRSGRGSASGAGQQRTEVGGTLRIEVDSLGRPRVRDVRRSGPMDIDVDAGPISLGG